MFNLSVYIKGVLLGAFCHARVIRTNGVIKLCGEVSPDGETFSHLIESLSVPSELNQALCALLQFPPDTRLLFSYNSSNQQAAFAIKTEGLCLAAAKTSSAPAFLLSLHTEQLAGSRHILLKATYEAAQLLCLDTLYIKVGEGILPDACTKEAGMMLPAVNSAKVRASDLAVIGQMTLSGRDNPFAQGLNALLGIDEITFAVLQDNGDIIAGLYIDEVGTGQVSVKNLCITIFDKQLCTSGELTIGSFRVLLGGSMGAGTFSFEGAMPPDTSIDLGRGWFIEELALAIGYQRGLTISMLGRIKAHRLMMFAALRVAILPGYVVELQLISAAASPLSLPVLVEAITGTTIEGVEEFDFIQIDGFSLPNAPCLTQEELNGGEETIPAGIIRALTPAQLEPKGEVRVKPLGKDWMVTDTNRMRHYLVKEDGQVLLNPQFYYATGDQPPLGGYTIQSGTFFCGVLRLFGYSIRVFFQADENGTMAYLNIQPIRTGVFNLTQSSYKRSRNVQMPSPGSLIEQYLDPTTEGPELFLRMSSSEQCFYLNARVQLWSILNFDAHILFAEKNVSIDAHFDFLKLFEVDLYVRADYSNFHALSFEVLLTANTNGLKKLVEQAVAKLEQASRKFNDSMQHALKKVDEARNSINGLWSEIHALDAKIAACRQRIRNTSRWKRWLVAIGVGLEIGGYEIAKAAIHVSIGVAQAALTLAEGILRAAQAVGDVTLKAVQEFLRGITALFYIQQLTLTGKVDASKLGAALGVQMKFVALGKAYSVTETLHLGDGAGDRCGQLLNDMVEKKTQDDIKQLEQGTRSSKQRYRAAALEGNLDLFRQGAEYYRRTNQYLEAFGEACVQQYGGIPAEADEILVGIDAAMSAVQQNSDLVLEITDKVQFASALNALEEKLNAQPESRVRAARKKNLEQLTTQWEELRKLKKQVRRQSTHIKTNTKQCSSQFMRSSAKNTATAQPPMTIEQLNRLNPDAILDQAENLMYHSFTMKKDSALLCLYSEPVIIQALDEGRVDSRKGWENRQKKRMRKKRNGYRERL